MACSSIPGKRAKVDGRQNRLRDVAWGAVRLPQGPPPYDYDGTARVASTPSQCGAGQFCRCGSSCPPRLRPGNVLTDARLARPPPRTGTHVLMSSAKCQANCSGTRSI